MGQNSLATALVISAMLGLRWLDDGPVRGRALAALGLAIVTSALFLTNARGAWLASAAGLISYLILLRWKRAWRTLVLVLAIGVTAFLLAGSGIAHLIGRAESIASLSPPSNRVRVALADSALAMLRAHPFVGTGLDTFSRLHASYPSRFFPGLDTHSSAHNIFLNMAAEGGVLGLGSFTWIVLITFGAVRRWYKNTPPRELPLISSVLAAFIGLLVNQQGEASMMSVHLGTAFWFLIAAQVAGASVPTTTEGLEQTRAGLIASIYPL